MDIRIMDIWNITKKRFALICIIVGITVAVTALMSFFVIQPQYEASAKLLVQSSSSSSALDYSELVANKELVATYSEIIRSNTIAETVIEQLNLPLTVDQLLKNVDVSSQEQSLVTVISVTDYNPDTAVKIANAFAQSFYENIDSIMKVDNVSILDEAVIYGEPVPVKPKPLLNISVAFFLSIIVGICLSIYLELVDHRVKTEEDIEQLLGLPVLGVVITYSHKRKKANTQHPKKLSKRRGRSENPKTKQQVVLHRGTEIT